MLFVFSTINCFSQAIVVDTTTYTIPELVTKVLVKSPCIVASNISWRTGNNYGSSTGIGYFETTNSKFLFKNGIVLSTGSVKNAAGPNLSIQNGGNSAWPGDVDLENTMLSAGIPMTSVNATVLEFDFTPISPTFNFDFLFASEEYGNSQCDFSDAFAYLLTDITTGITTNLAVVPSTNTPISVLTVRDNAFNSKCTSNNSEYFDNYYGGALAPLAATNFNGNTVKMTAKAVLNPNAKYHIKLVIADRLNSGLDSAIFISSTNFNLSQEVLGLDLTVSDGTAICSGATFPDLNTGLDPSIYNFSWKKNGVTIPGQTNPNLTGVSAGTYTVTYTNYVNVCEPTVDIIKIESFPAIITGTPNDIYKCDSGLSSYQYNLALNSPVLLTGSGSPETPFDISYHISATDANAGINDLPLLFNSPSNVTIHARVENLLTKCYVVKTFQLLTTIKPTANKPNDILQCSLTPATSFNLSSTKPEVLMAQSSSINTITYYTSQNEADTAVGPLNSTNFVSEGQTIYTRIQSRDDETCYNLTNFKLIVDIIEPLDIINPKFVCNPYTLKALTRGNYYDQPLGGGNQYFAGDIITQLSLDPLNNVKTLYIYDPSIICKPTPQNKLVITFVNISEITPDNGTFCSNIGFKLPTLSYGKYYTQPNGPTGTGVEIPSGTLINTSQRIYTYFKSDDDSTCVSSSNFDISIINTPMLPPFNNIYDCTTYILPPLTVGNYYDQPKGLGNIIPAGTKITVTQEIFVYSSTGTVPNCFDSASFTVFISDFPHPTDSINCINYTLPELPVGNYYTAPGGLGNMIPAKTVINVTTTLYIYNPASVNSSCSSFDFPFTITVNLPPLINPNDTSISYCGSYKLLPLTNGNYYESVGGKGNLLNAGHEINATQTIYLYLSIGTCKNEYPITIKITKLPEVDNRANLEFCGGETYLLTPMSTGSSGNYYTNSGGTGIPLYAGDAITTSQNIYVYATTNTKPPCPVENYFSINFTPRVEVFNPVVVCDKYILPPLISGNYYTQSNAAGVQLNAGDVILFTQKIYIHNIFNNRNGPCVDESNFDVSVLKPRFISQPVSRTICDNDGRNDGIATISTTTLTDDLLNEQLFPPSDYAILYYKTILDATNNVNKITTFNSSEIYFKIYKKLTPTCFSDIGKVNVVVNKIPMPKPNGGFICVDKNIPIAIQSGLSGSNLIFEWYNNNASVLLPDNGNNISVTTPDVYGVKVTDNISTCSSNIVSAEVLSSSAPTNISYAITSAFSNEQILTIIASGINHNFEYKLDAGPYQDSPTFQSFGYGEHVVTVRDKNGCGFGTQRLSLINFPKFFTPNSDGRNDTWNIDGLQNLTDCYIYIYDRYGKLVKQIEASGAGWDGLYNGRELPASDYWFTVIYKQEGVQKEYKNHFSLKR